MAPHGQALEDEHYGRRQHDLVVEREDGYTDAIPVGEFFAREPINPEEAQALELCRGRVLDVGAGAGRHALLLQKRGLSVQAIDVSPQAVRVMQDRGVREPRCADLMEYAGGEFDTILMLGHGLGLVGELARLPRWLDRLAGLLAAGGQVLADSVDVGTTQRPVHLEYLRFLEAAGRYRGEVRFSLQYGDLVGPELPWLHVDFETLCSGAAACGWQAEFLAQEEGGTYWCRLTPQT